MFLSILTKGKSMRNRYVKKTGISSVLLSKQANNTAKITKSTKANETSPKL